MMIELNRGNEFQCFKCSNIDITVNCVLPLKKNCDTQYANTYAETQFIKIVTYLRTKLFMQHLTGYVGCLGGF